MAEQHTTESGFKTNLLPNWLQWSTNTVQMCITGIMSIALSSPWHQTSDSILNSAFVAIMTSSKCHRRTVWWYRSKQSTCHRLKNVPVILTVSTKLEPCTVFRHVVGVWSCREWGLPWSCDTLDNRFPRLQYVRPHHIPHQHQMLRLTSTDAPQCHHLLPMSASAIMKSLPTVQLLQIL